jgi:MFS family permease
MSFDFLATTPRRKFLFAALYLSEGAPIGFIWWALPTRLRVEDVPVDRITWLLSLLVIPWTFKFLWAPLVDVVRNRHWSLRSWIVAAQSVMTLSLVPLLFLDLQTDFAAIAALLLVHAFAAATQDVAIDAWCISIITPAERGAFNGWMQSGMLVGRSLMGGGALIMRPWIGDSAVIVLLTLLTGFSMTLVLMSGSTRYADEVPHVPILERARSVARLVLRTLLERNTWVGVAFAVTSGAAYQAVNVVAGPFLIDQGFAEADVGWFFAVPVIACMICGALAGGWLSDRLGRRRFALIGQLAIVIPVLALALALFHGFDRHALMVLTGVIFFGTGLFTAAVYSLLMELTNPLIAATQFSSFMGGINACEAWSGLTVGILVTSRGYPFAFAVMAGLSILTLPLLLAVRLQRATVDKPPPD